jgi:phospholipase/lecithinase/hemolysin
MIKMIKCGFLCISLVLLITPAAFAFSTIVAYGDSLTDDGHSWDLGFWNGIVRKTDGALWVETLAGLTGSNLMDTAFAGATTGYDNPAVGIATTGLQWQIDTRQPLINPMVQMDSTLFTVWAGANDFFDDRDYEPAAENIGLALEKLAGEGVQDILTANLPDIGYTPDYYNDVKGPGTMADASAWTIGFNTALEAELADFKNAHADVDVYFLDVFMLFNDYIETDPSGDIINIPEWEALFWDEVHPSEIGHNMIAQGAYDALNPVPVPPPVLLLFTGLIGLAGMRSIVKKSVLPL